MTALRAHVSPLKVMWMRQSPLFALTELEQKANAAQTTVIWNAPRVLEGPFRVESRRRSAK
jgi:hypothetical protein